MTDEARSAESRPRDGRLVVMVLVAFALGLAGLASLGRPRLSLIPQAPKPRPSLACLPFVNLSADPDLEAIAVSISRVLEGSLSAPDSGFDYKEMRNLRFPVQWERDVSGFAASVDADYVLAGSLDLANDGLRIDGFLVRPGAQFRLWAESFRFAPGEQRWRHRHEEIVSEVAGKIRDSLTNALPELSRPQPKPFIP